MAAELKAYLTGWREYFQQAETPGSLPRPRQVDPAPAAVPAAEAVEAGKTVYRELRARGMSARRGGQGRREHATVVAQLGAWLLNIALPNRYFDELGVPRLAP